MRFENMNAIVTGASTGIGREIAVAIAANGGRVGLVGRNIEGLQRTEELVRNSGGVAKIFQIDLRKESDINKLASEAKSTFGNVDILANVAGVWHDENNVYYGNDLFNTPSKQIDEVLDVGIRAPMQLARLLIPDMVERKHGKILNISGTFSSGGAGWLHYYVSKLALEHFTVGLASELRKHEIQVNCISPSDVATDALKKFFPDDAGSALDPSEVAKLAIFLLSKEADHISGQIIVIKNKSSH